MTNNEVAQAITRTFQDRPNEYSLKYLQEITEAGKRLPGRFWDIAVTKYPSGVPKVTRAQLMNHFSKNRHDVLDILKADKQVISKEPTQISSVPTEEPERYEHVTKQICSEDIPINTIEQIVEKIIDRRLSELKEGLLTKQYGLELAPPRSFIKGRRGKRENRKPRDIATSLDKELYKRFEADRNRYGVSESFMLDTILWHFYQKPKLSYELDPLRLEPDED